MKKLLLIFSFLAVAHVTAHCQGFYFKVGPGYDLSVSQNQMPDYLAHNVMISTGMGFSRFNVNLNVTEFSVASGINLQVAAGYRLNDFISLELRFSAFTNSRKEFEATPRGSSDGMTEWQLQTYSLLPTIMIGQTFNKTSLSLFAWSGAGITDLNIITSFKEDYREFEFERQASFSWGYGLEFSYAISGKLSLYSNIGINNSYYRPDRAHMTDSYLPAENLDTYQKEIVYVDEITNLQLSSSGGPVPYDPAVRLTETLRSNSLSGGLGIKISPWR